MKSNLVLSSICIVVFASAIDGSSGRTLGLNSATPSQYRDLGADVAASGCQEACDANRTWTSGETWVSKLSPEQFESLLGLRPPPDLDLRIEQARQANLVLKALPGMAFPPRFDWREQGAVTPIKNQGMCGSCWAFAAAAALESQILIRTGLEEDISEQAVITCNPYNNGCAGGWMSTAYDLWMTSGAVRESCMPYHAGDDEQCKAETCQVVARLADYYYVGDSVEDIKQALLSGPITVAMAVCRSFASYTGGCYQEDCSEINHAVTLVGWDDTLCGGVWIVKNSWGPDWGMDGYAYIKYGSCGIGYGAQALVFNPTQTVHFFHHSHTIDDSEGNGNGFIEIGEKIRLRISVINIGAETATNVSLVLRSLSPGVDLVDSVSNLEDIPKGDIGTTPTPYPSFVLTNLDQDQATISFLVDVRSNQGGSGFILKLQVGEVIKVFEDDFETDKGWTVGEPGDDAKTGMWERADPQGTWWGNQPVQPEDDHTQNGINCYVTGALAGDHRGSYDVDGGRTTLLSPIIDLSSFRSAVVTYYRWFSSNTGQYPNDDDFIVDVSNDGGLTWWNLERLGFDDRTWRKREFNLEEILPLTERMRFRFIAEDRGLGGSIVEAAIDDFSIFGSRPSLADTTPPSVVVISPNGGETLTQDEEYSIRWYAFDQAGIASVSILLSQDGGMTFLDTLVCGLPNSGEYIWHVAEIRTQRARIKVVARDFGGNSSDDTSDGDFTIRPTGSGGSTELPQLPSGIDISIASSNPTGADFRLVIALPSKLNVCVSLHDVLGRSIINLFEGEMDSGWHIIELDRDLVKRLSSGVYFVRLEHKGGSCVKKVVIAH